MQTFRGPLLLDNDPRRQECEAKNSLIENGSGRTRSGSGRTRSGSGVVLSGIRLAALAAVSALDRRALNLGCVVAPEGTLTEETAAVVDGCPGEGTRADSSCADSPSSRRESAVFGGDVFSKEAGV